MLTVSSTSGFYSPPIVFLNLRFLPQQLKVGGAWLCLHYLFVFKAALFFVHLFPIEKIIKNASTGGKPDKKLFNRGIFLDVLYSTLLHLPPPRSTVSEDAGVEPRTVATSALA